MVNIVTLGFVRCREIISEKGSNFGGLNWIIPWKRSGEEAIMTEQNYGVATVSPNVANISMKPIVGSSIQTSNTVLFHHRRECSLSEASEAQKKCLQ